MSVPAVVKPVDSGLVCLVMLARFHKIAASPEQLIHEMGKSNSFFHTPDILLAAKKLGLKATHVSTQWSRLNTTPLPAIAETKDGHYFILAQVASDKVLIEDIVGNCSRAISEEEFKDLWNGKLILLASRASIAGDLAKFDFTWFIPSIIKYRKFLIEVLIASFFLQLFALVTPLFFQVVMDKVLVHRGYTTLDVIAFGLLVVMIFEVVLTGLRTYLFSHTTNRIDVELGSRLFQHLVTLPLAYFEARRVGDSVARIRELENIRSFLTGNAITVVLDLFFSVVFIAVMAYYSLWLTLVVVLSLPCYVLVSVGITPILRRRLNEKFNRGAENQAFLVETINGIQTLKATAVEPQMRKHWDNQLAGYVASSFRVAHLSNIGSQAVSLINKLVVVITMWLGARFVIDGSLSVGQLIAFNMLAARVASPVMRLAQLWQDFQQTGISIQRLGDILNARTEVSSVSQSSLPPIKGSIEFDKVIFRYRPDTSEVLRNVSLKINPGEVIGIVGRSGSGKSTLTKLLQRLYTPERGRVLIDGVDLALVNPAWLRRQIGVVLQENMLFNRSVRENIALADPGIPIEKVIEAAKLAGAHEFILELPNGYDTMVGEHGATLSGGQRQRIAIARALIANPKVLIFDEATSALDYESESVIQNNMKAICQGRTVLIIAHRLTAVRDADRIIVLDHGQIVEDGAPKELSDRKDGYYAKLLRLQQNENRGAE